MLFRNLWNDDDAAQLPDLEGLVYRSNILGQDRAVCNWAGGNTSMKRQETDHRGRTVDVMWVKGSGTDLKTITREGFTPLLLADLLPLMERDEMSDEEMVSYIAHTTLHPNVPRGSIETLLHAFVPAPHVDHSHPDPIVAICCAEDGEQIAQEIWGDEAVWVPYLRPGFGLSRVIGERVRANPGCRAVIMAKHGLVTWGETSKECYHNTLRVVDEAQAYLDEAAAATPAPFAEKVCKPLPAEERAEVAAAVMPLVRGAAGQDAGVVLHFDDSESVLDFVCAADAPRVAAVGAACPDHLVRTKRTPLFVAWEPDSGTLEELEAALGEGLAAYAEDYRRFFAENKDPDDPYEMDPPSPRVILIPGVGMVTTGRNKRMAEVAAALYHRAIAVMTGAEVLGGFISLSERESYRIEYWALERYKLQLAPPERELSRKVAVVTGGAGGIGSATARQLAAAGAHVVVTDIDTEGAAALAGEICDEEGPGRAVSLHMDVTDEDSVARAYAQVVRTYGGVDCVVANAGIASASPVDETDLATWQRNYDILAGGYFLTAREAFRLMKRQGLGGSMVFVGSKNAVLAARNAGAYSSAKAASVHLARCLAEEGGPEGIRVNVVNPDAVLSGSKIWQGSWRQERADGYGVEPDELEEHYRRRSVLGRSVLPGDVASAVVFLLSPRAAKTTGCMISVDAGITGAYPR